MNLAAVYRNNVRIITLEGVCNTCMDVLNVEIIYDIENINDNKDFIERSCSDIGQQFSDRHQCNNGKDIEWTYSVTDTYRCGYDEITYSINGEKVE